MITKTTVVRGSIVGKDDLTIEGQVEGSVRIEGKLTIGSEASLKADVSASSVSLDGQVEGSVDSESSVVMTSDAVVIGTVKTKRLSVAEGAKLKGRIEMDFDI